MCSSVQWAGRTRRCGNSEFRDGTLEPRSTHMCAHMVPHTCEGSRLDCAAGHEADLHPAGWLYPVPAAAEREIQGARRRIARGLEISSVGDARTRDRYSASSAVGIGPEQKGRASHRQGSRRYGETDPEHLEVVSTLEATVVLPLMLG